MDLEYGTTGVVFAGEICHCMDPNWFDDDGLTFIASLDGVHYATVKPQPFSKKNSSFKRGGKVGLYYNFGNNKISQKHNIKFLTKSTNTYIKEFKNMHQRSDPKCGVFYYYNNIVHDVIEFAQNCAAGGPSSGKKVWFPLRGFEPRMLDSKSRVMTTSL
eukprot:scaffold7940_cov167-Amphora_coffeaeformis.AAC.8